MLKVSHSLKQGGPVNYDCSNSHQYVLMIQSNYMLACQQGFSGVQKAVKHSLIRGNSTAHSAQRHVVSTF